MPAHKTEIDLEELEKLCALQCTDEEIAAWFNVCKRTIARRRSEPGFAEVMERGRARGRISVRRAQMRMLEAGNSTMGVWLGKQILGQRDHVGVEVAVEPQPTSAELREQLAHMLREHPEILEEMNAIAAEYSVVSETQPPAALTKWSANDRSFDEAPDDLR